MKPDVTAFFNAPTYALTYVVADTEGGHCAIIDSVLDYDPKSGRTRTEAADEVIAFVRERGLAVDWIMETHAHADHLTAAPYLKEQLGGKVAIGARIAAVQAIFKDVFNAGDDFAADGFQFDHLFQDGERFEIGGLTGEVMHTPGHTPACAAYVVGDACFAGDTIFMPDFGTARTDFPAGDAAELYASIQRILALAPETRLFMCHDYAPGGRDYAWETTVAEQRADNIHVGGGVGEADFVKLRNERDAALDFPTLILPSVQVNMRAGHFPPAEDNGIAYLKVPIDTL
jgi:glyoxylase-like metal-dependent hydrolase (beta-lactamase superfamily II)